MGRLSASLDATRAALERASLALASRHAVADDAYNTLVARENVDRGLLAERARLEKRLAEATAVAKRHEARDHEIATLRKQGGRLQADLALARDAHLSLRERAVQEINDAMKGTVQVSLKPGEDRSAYEALLAELTEGANIRPASFLHAIAREVRPADLYRYVENDDVERLTEIDPAKTPTSERARKVLAALRASGRAHEVLTVALEDEPILELVTDQGPQPIRTLSSGERCIALLPIILLKARGPLIMDEPEQHLHNKYVYSTLVRLMAEAERRGQLIFATHNANIVVLGNAKRVVALAAKGGHGRVEEVGTVDEVRSAIEILEGGKEAFRRRAREYGEHRADA
jgi:predicted ATPase